MSPLADPTRWLRESAAVHRTSDCVVHVRGDDARSWLNGQISNDVRSLTGDAACYALALTLKGRIVSDLWAVAEPPGMAIVLPAATRTAALARFEQHIIMEDVELEPDDALEVVTVQGPLAAEVSAVLPAEVRKISCPRLGTVGIDCWLPRSDSARLHAALVERAEALGGGALDDAGWAAAHVALAVPRVQRDFDEQSYPQEAGLRHTALSFGKGCYLGQEVVYMLDNRGQVARRLVQLQGSDPSALASGAAVLDGEGKRIGEVTSVTIDPTSGDALGLAYLKRAHAEPERTVWVATSPYRVRSIVGAP